MKGDRRQAYVEAAVHRILDDLIGVGKGGRNNALNRAAFAIGQFVGAGALSRQDAEYMLEKTGALLGLKPREMAVTIKSGLNRGADHPRQLPEGDEVNVSVPHRAVERKIEPLIGPPENLKAILQSAWDLLRAWNHRDASPELRSFMIARRLKWRDVLNYGCVEIRDQDRGWFPDTLGTLAELGEESLGRSLGWAGDFGLWLGWQEPGLIVPLWSQIWPDAPVAYRWRPWAEKRRAKRKTWAMSGSEPWRQWPLISTVKGSRAVVIVEGEPDFLTMWRELSELGISCIGLPGASWPEAWDQLLRFKAVIVATDADEAGQAVAKKIGLACDQLRIRFERVEPQGAKDWSDVVSQGIASAAQIAAFFSSLSRDMEAT